MEAAAPSRLEARDYWRIINKRKWFIIAVGTMAMLAGGIYAASYPTTFRAQATVWVRQPPQFFWSAGQRSPTREQPSLETQAALAASSGNAKLTAERLAARSSQKPINVEPSKIVDSLSMRVSPPDRILIEVTHPRRDYAIAIANETARTFLETSAELRRSEDSYAVAFLENQLEVAEKELNDALKQKQQRQKEWGMANPLASQTLLGVLEQYKASLTVAQADLAATSARRAALGQKCAAEYSSEAEQQIVLNPLQESLQRELRTTQMALVKLRARYMSDHPAIRQLETQVQELTDEIQREPQTIKTATIAGPEKLAQTKAQLAATELQVTDQEARIEALQDLIDKAEREALELIEKEGTLAQLEDKGLLARLTFESLLQDLRDSKLKVAAERGTATILNAAIDAQRIKPSVGRTVVFGAMLGLFAGILLSLLLEALDETIRTPEDIVRDTTVPFLGMVLWSEQDIEQLVTIVSPRSPPAEAFRTLRSNINFALVDEPAKSLLVTSAGAGEGKSVIAANVAAVYAQAGQSVIVVDTDLRRPVLHRIFEADATRGLTNILVGELPLEAVLQDTPIDNLRIITSGPLPPNPAALLDSARMQTLLDQISEEADIIIYDSPPAIMLTDAIVLSSKIDRTILLAEAGQVSRQAFNEMVRLITQARGNILGAVLNKVKVTAGDYYYYYYYYYYDYASRTGEEAKTPPAESPIAPL